MGNGSADVWRRRTATAVALLFPVAAGAVTLAASATYDGAEVVGRPSPGWQTIEYDGLDVDIPTSWRRTDLGDCEGGAGEAWTASAAEACDDDPGVYFLDSATFCPAHGPALRREPGPGPRRWSGYRTIGDLTVSVSATDRDVARQVLRSVDRSAERDDAPAEPSFQ